MAATHTRFTQHINGQDYILVVDKTHVESLLNKVDTRIDRKKFDEAVQLITPHLEANLNATIIHGSNSTPIRTKIVRDRSGNKLASAMVIINENPNMGRTDLVNLVAEKLGITYANARYLVVNKAGK